MATEAELVGPFGKYLAFLRRDASGLLSFLGERDERALVFGEPQRIETRFCSTLTGHEDHRQLATNETSRASVDTVPS